jgi:3-deoxy-manno-octulosonate cytidylyltransferase (CMP-KDO synthetase)
MRMNVGFSVLIPARLASTRLPGKPLADIGGVPMIVRVAQRAALSGASSVMVCADHMDILAACERYDVAAMLTSPDHATGTDRVAEACGHMQLEADGLVVNVQGDEPLIDPALIAACAVRLQESPECVMSTAACPIDNVADLDNPNVVKVVVDAQWRALYFSRAAIPWSRDGRMQGTPLPDPPALRHIGIYAYRVPFLARFPALRASPLETTEALEQLRVLWHGERIAVVPTAHAPGPGVDTPEDLERVRRIVAAEAAKGSA